MPHKHLKLLAFFCLSALISFQTLAQQKQLTIEDVFLNPSLSPANLKQLTWVPGTNDYSLLNDKSDQLLRGTVRENARVVATAAEVSTALEKVGGAKITSLGGVQWLNSQEVLINQKGQLYRYHLKNKSAQPFYKIGSGAENLDYAPNKQRVAYTKAQNLFISQPGAEDKQITQEQNSEIVNGQAAHRSE
ncbi:MAG: DPP IV N-terminal domain-containing protein, partial [Rufibacter sp.]